MEIIGVPHAEEYIGQVEQYLDENYPDGIKSLLVELPLNPPNIVDAIKLKFPAGTELYDPFFSTIANKYRNKGTRIIHGDISREIIGTRDMILHPLKGLNELFSDKRDNGIRQIFEQELPEVTLLGTSHAERLKKTFPEIPFTHFYTRGNSLGEMVGNYIVNMAKRYADKTICLD